MEMTNRKLLELSPEVLTGIQKQRRYCLQMALEKMECPACQAMVSKVDAIGGDIEAYDTKGVERDYACPSCRRTLTFCVPFIGRCWWRLKFPVGADPNVDAPAAGK